MTRGDQCGVPQHEPGAVLQGQAHELRLLASQDFRLRPTLLLPVSQTTEAANVNKSSSQIDFGKPSPGRDTTAWWLVVDPLREKRFAGAQLTPAIRER